MNNLELTEAIFKKYGIKYHKITEGDYTYVNPFNTKDTNGHIFVEGYGLVELTDSRQLTTFIEFHKGDIASY